MTTKISKSLLESISNVVNSDSKNLTESYDYINKKNHKASNTDQLEDLIAAELDLGGVDDEDLETMLDLFKKGYDIAVSVERDGTASELKKDGYTIGNFAIYKNEAAKRQQIYVKAPAGMKEESEQMSEAKDFVYDYQGKDPYEFVDGFDDAEGTKVGNWMRRPEAMKKLMKAANTNSYEFKEVILPKGKEDTEAEVEKQMKDKGYKLFDTGMNFGSGNLLTGPKGNYFTGLLFYKKK